MTTLIAVGSWRGIGASTSALLLAAGAAATGEQAWLIEADPAGGVLSSRADELAGGLAGLERVAFHPSGEPPHRALEGAARRLGDVSVLTGAWDSFQAWATVASPRQPWAEGLRRLDGFVVVDVGSLRGGGVPTWPIVEMADVLMMVTSPEPGSLTSTVAWMDAKGQSAPGVQGLSLDTSRVLVVDAPVTTGARFEPDVSAELGDRFAGWWPWEPKVVDHLHRGGSLDHRAIRRFALPRAVDATLSSLMIDRHRAVGVSS